jgi:hypothetical protein
MRVLGPVMSALTACIVAEPSCALNTTFHQLPEGNLNVGYANWAQVEESKLSGALPYLSLTPLFLLPKCDDKIVKAVEQGLNVVIWFSINLAKDDEGNQIINGAVPDLDCVARVVKELRDKNLPTTHLISVGGWNSPLPDTSFTGVQWWEHFHRWNKEIVARPDLGWEGFHGIDWDPEGSNDRGDEFTVEVMDLIGEMSVLAKQHGYLVTMAPAQSYFDANTTSFDLSTTHASPYWQPDFHYHGHNLYAYWAAKYGKTKMRGGDMDGTIVPTFDWVAVQLYEGFSLANYKINVEKVSVTDYLAGLVDKMEKGWEVDFGSDKSVGLASQIVKVHPTRLLIGLANGWTHDAPPIDKFLLLWPSQIEEAYLALPEEKRPRGFMFWDIADEGNEIEGKTLYMAEGLNNFLHTRN